MDGDDPGARRAEGTGSPPGGAPPGGQELRGWRGRRGMSLSALAQAVHYSKGYLSKIENGDKPMTPDVARRCDAVLETGGALAALVDRGGGHVCPYPGLSPFGPEEHRWFFGREQATARLVARLGERTAGGGPLVVVAPSGAGKSSLLHAGLLPALADGALPGSAGWRTVRMTPSGRPLRSLAGHVAAATGVGVSGLRAGVDDPHTWRALLGDAAGPAGRLLVLVDQFEELFTECRDEEARHSFVRALQAASAPSGPGAAADPPALVVLSLRADLYGRCLAYPELVAALEEGHFPLGPMTRGELLQAVTGPARAEGLELESGLTELLLQELGALEVPPGQDAYPPGALPLLAHALRETWRQREGDRLTVAGYRRSGGIGHAVATTAEGAYQRLTPQEQTAARHLLTRLVHVDTATGATRRRQSRAELLEQVPAPGKVTRRVLASFIRARLITAGTDGDDSVDITHEALLRAWPRLRRWIGADLAGLQLHHRLADAALQWHTTGRDPSELIRGARLVLAQEWAARPSGRQLLGPLEAAFLDASAAAERHGRLARRRRDRRLRQLSGALAVCLVLAVLAGLTAWQQSEVAGEQARLAVSRELAALSEATAAHQVEAPMTLAVAAFDESPTPAALGALLSTQAHPYAGQLAGHGGKPVNALAFTPDGRTVVTAGDDGAVRLWEVTGRKRTARLTVPGTGLTAVAVDPSGSVLAVAGRTGAPRLYDMRSRRGTGTLAVTAPVHAVAFSPDGSLLASGEDDGTVRLWQVRDRRRPGPVFRVGGAVRALAFRPGDGTLAVAGADGTVTFWDAATGRGKGSALEDAGEVEDIAYSPDGSLLAVAGADGVRVRDLRTHADRGRLTGHTDTVLAVAFSRDGSTIATGGRDNTVRLWQTAGPSALSVLPGHSGPVGAVAFGAGGLLATAGDDAVVRLWDPARGPSHHRPVAPLLAVDRHGGRVVTGAADGRVTVWDAARRRAVHSFRAHDSEVRSVLYGRAGSLLVTSGDDGRIRLWGPDGRRPAGEFPVQSAPVKTLALSRDGTRLVSGSDDGTARLWDVAGRRQIGEPMRHHADHPVFGVALSPDGSLLATAGQDETVQLWRTSDRRRLRTLDEHDDTVFTAAFSPDGTLLATAGRDCTVRLYRLDVLRRPGSRPAPVVLSGHTGPIVSMRFDRTGDTLVTSSRDGTARLWDIPGRAPGATLRGHTGRVADAVFDGDDTLHTVSRDGTWRTWDLDPRRVAAHVCERVPPPTRAYWERIAPGTPYRDGC
ncbi:helix-turn-helix domain-containing protein [Streptomyces sp. NPDC014676]|uniref:nSTAND1 domain-containing NTPase n=1 Tax=Streptomyces sp. NPDC014676 TaxID=3364879 RepID=UPI00370030B7